MKKPVLFLLMIIIASIVLAEDVKAITDNGKTVILHENGTWEILINENSQDSFDFRKINWGMSKSDVMKSEPFEWEEGELDPNTQVLYTNIDLMSEETMLVYYFNVNRVYQTRYIIKEIHSNKTEYWRVYKRLMVELKNKYGDPVSNYTGDPIWLDDLYQDDPNDWGMAIATGDMFALAKWNLPKNTISALIQGDNYKINIFLEFKANNIKVIEAEETDAF